MNLALRPRFSMEVRAPSREVLARLTEELAKRPVVLRGTRPVGGGPDAGHHSERDHLVMTVPPTQRHFWSPWLTIEVSPRGDGTLLDGQFTPHPSVWTAFMFGYLALGVVLMFSLILAGSLAMTGGDPWSLWISAAAGIGAGVMWWISQLGQRLAHTQMLELRRELERALPEPSPPTA